MCNRDQDGFDLARRGLDALGDAATPLRARILGWAANMGGWIAPYEVAEGLSREAISLANALGDGRLVGMALINEASFRFAYYQLGRSAAAGARAAELLGASGDLWNMTGAQATSAMSLVELGQFAEARALCAQVQDLGPRLGQFAALFCLDWVQSLLTVSAADLERFEADAVKALELFNGMNFESLLLPRLGSAAFLRGDWDTAVDLTEQGTRHELPNRFHGVAFGPLMQIRGYRGERAAALEVLDQQRDNLPRSGQPNGYGSWQFLGWAIEGLAILGEHARCAELYPMAREFAATEVALTAPTGRLTQRVAGIAAMAAQDWVAAEAHFAAALRLADELPHRLEAAETARWYAHMLLDCGATGDRAKASALLCDAHACYSDIGMLRHLWARPRCPRADLTFRWRAFHTRRAAQSHDRVGRSTGLKHCSRAATA